MCFPDAVVVLVRKGRFDFPHPIHFSFLILGKWAGDIFLSLVPSWENQELGYYSRVPLCTYDTWSTTEFLLPPSSPGDEALTFRVLNPDISDLHLWLFSSPSTGIVSTSSISPGQGLRFMEGKFSLTQFSPREQEVLTNVLPHYGQGYSTHPRRPVLGARGTPSHSSDRVRRQWTRLPFPCVPAFPLHTSLQNIQLAEVPAEEKEHVGSRELKKMVRDKAHLTVSRCLLLSWSDL